MTSTGATLRVGLSMLLGIAAGAGVAFLAPWQAAALGGWDVTAIVFVAWVWLDVGRMHGEDTRTLALREDPNREVADLLLTGASLGCLVGVALVLVKSADAHGIGEAGLVALALVSVVSSWLVVQTVFALRYARIYYGEPEGGIDFNGAAQPSFMDFAYVAFTVGMTYQVSDTALSTESMRRAALRHALLSFVFGTFILATTINAVAGLLR